MLCFGLYMYASESPSHSFKPEGGFVPDEATAINIAQAVLTPIYGKEKLEKEKPLVAKQNNGVWIVSGTMQKGLKGGVSIIEILKDDARILRVSHGK